MADPHAQPRPPAGTLKIFLIATEESGDRLGAALMRALREASGGNVQFSGVGGRAMEAVGLASLYPIDDMAIMGITAIPRRVPLILRRIRATAAAVIASRPDVLVIIDSPDFTHRVARRVRAELPTIPIVDYVSPSVWAWRPGRAPAMRAYIDHVLALLPFEPDVHARLGGPPCTYVGHPIVEEVGTLRPNDEETRRRRSSPPLLLVLPGSRTSEIRRHSGPFDAAIKLIAERRGPLELVLPTVPHLHNQVRQATANWAVTPRIVVDPRDKRAAFRNARAALAASGTVTLELALAGVPAIVAYKRLLVEYMIFRPLIQVPSIVLANLVLGENVMPELIQHAATPERLAAALAPLLADTAERQAQTKAFARLDAIMDIGGRPPSAKAADIVLDVARRGRDHFRREIGV
jgi:lipid-A-disaccharide synthase